MNDTNAFRMLPSPQDVRRGSRVRGMKWRVFKRAWARKLSRFRANTRRLLGDHELWWRTQMYAPLPAPKEAYRDLPPVVVDSSSAPGFVPTPKVSP